MKPDYFVRIPKTGSTSLLSSLYHQPYPWLEAGLHEYCYKVDNKGTGNIFNNSEFYPCFNLSKYRKIYTIVRNPYDLLISYYYHDHPPEEKLQNKELNKLNQHFSTFNENIQDGWSFCNQIHQFKSWEDFLESYINPNFKWHLPPMKKSLFSMAYDKEDNLIVDRYFKIENPDNINNFLRFHNLPPLRILNKTLKKPNRKFYNSNHVEKLNKIWERDLKYFNYKYEGQ